MTPQTNRKRSPTALVGLRIKPTILRRASQAARKSRMTRNAFMAASIQLVADSVLAKPAEPKAA